MEIASLAVVTAAMSNTVVKGSIVIFVGHPNLRKANLPDFLLILAAGVLLARLTFG